MNNGNSSVLKSVPDPTKDDKRWQLVQRVLRSPEFAKAPRMCALLSFLTAKVLSGTGGTINEQLIAVEVFRRDPRDFDTTIDPIVRVQMGRLRTRLAHVGAAGSSNDMRIVIPAGSYVPEFTAQPMAAACVPAIRMAPLRALTPDSDATSFVCGLEEELAQRLFQRFGHPRLHTAEEYGVHVSVRVEALHARASIRLTEAGNDQVVWLHQCDCHGSLGIALQETLALAICDDLSSFLAGGASRLADGPLRPVDRGVATRAAY